MGHTKKKALTPIILYYITIFMLIGSAGNWYFVFKPSSYEYGTLLTDWTKIIFELAPPLMVAIILVYLILLAEQAMAKAYWIACLSINIVKETIMLLPAPDTVQRLTVAFCHSLVVIISIMFIVLYHKYSVNLFGKHNILYSKQMPNKTL
jgi:hypothetical protein